MRKPENQNLVRGRVPSLSVVSTIGQLLVPSVTPAVSGRAPGRERRRVGASWPKGATPVDAWATMDGQLGAHEYLGSHFGPLMFDQVAAAMAAVK